MKTSLHLPKLFGIDFRIHWTFTLLIIYIVYINMRAGMDAVGIGWMILYVLSLFACVTLHELGHALAARRYGIITRDITLYPIGGVARLERMPEKPKQELIVALAGPLVNFVITAVLLLFVSLDGLVGETADGDETRMLVIHAGNFFPMIALINVWLALFNLIPAFPMDGGRVLRALLSMTMDRVKATNWAAGIGKVLAAGFVVAGFFVNPFLIVIGVFIILGAQGEAQMVRTQRFISPFTAREVLMTNFASLDKYATINDAVKLLLDGEARNFLVTDNGVPFGVVTRDLIIRGISEKGEATPLVNIADQNLVYAALDTPLEELYSEFQRTGMPLILVTSGGALAGVVDADNILEFIMVHQARSAVQV